MNETEKRLSNGTVSKNCSSQSEKSSGLDDAVHGSDPDGSRSSDESAELHNGLELPNSGGATGTWRPLRSRSFLTDAQVAILHSHFKRNPFPSKYELSAVAEQIGVNKRVVQVNDHYSFYALSSQTRNER
ncbi:unnamed protein product [Gongylonema pulchrum]|uniref:Homeobox domain-containing protein n=1 Tax=Gongylonema pulchrum TaxID=637853 RepID=A0A183EPG3_9BILA|nr:unnamed protein product [Gongylonema pulchrum]